MIHTKPHRTNQIGITREVLRVTRLPLSRGLALPDVSLQGARHGIADPSCSLAVAGSTAFVRAATLSLLFLADSILTKEVVVAMLGDVRKASRQGISLSKAAADTQFSLGINGVAKVVGALQPAIADLPIGSSEL